VAPDSVVNACCGSFALDLPTLRRPLWPARYGTYNRSCTETGCVLTTEHLAVRRPRLWPPTPWSKHPAAVLLWLCQPYVDRFGPPIMGLRAKCCTETGCVLTTAPLAVRRPRLWPPTPWSKQVAAVLLWLCEPWNGSFTLALPTLGMRLHREELCPGDGLPRGRPPTVVAPLSMVIAPFSGSFSLDCQPSASRSKPVVPKSSFLYAAPAAAFGNEGGGAASGGGGDGGGSERSVN
jgi:uncharacterized protein YggT (Ycf19 family)